MNETNTEFCSVCKQNFENNGPIGTPCGPRFCPDCELNRSDKVRVYLCVNKRHWQWCTKSMMSIENRTSICGDCEYSDICPERWDRG